ncbi:MULTISPECIES: aldehyde dehydrogenase [Halomonadaceae]|jgi:gamma-glutamyl-gamma-aminobutyraldehyde dehydrogenase|uniref:NADP/NAD-dependent aldehyde dehydrogenase PuuC n=1 Tax=Vreelandella titanicae TaxID=664683 RepID=A0A653Z862_9GAMM|nr:MULTISPECIES: aldehyde dehydrogenase [Halomonas]QKS25865.1 NADP/NAD-dependent aldehyde dehydrogenase PuuC [Halomonas titanicae]TMU28213.1 aldehyde dehydrogenase [Halomonas sp. ATBC28]CAD5262837.1 NADP/NAD-dependent aldehyde dehydrogenase PuuC [Halomonas sp. 113]CAD5264743.1 NADP/NAD-dependent aldehyde dehydrogenase PuuC [Halomonas sp. 59]CAD5277611.1 NADP/NAD-dependent aldehyde dehydrogenase PuuC [Halomonas sp. I3]|tara:strand:+ start:1265 stop:2770 length:1506 start_codon:yes stop_codon:yes gene_type:complete
MANTLTQENIAQQIERLEYRNLAFIDGQFVPARSGKTFATLNPATGEVITQLAACDAEDVDIAAKAARRAFEAGVWSKMAPAERKAIMQRFADLIEENCLELAVLEAIEAGKPISECFNVDIPDTANTIRWHAEAIDKLNDAVTPTESSVLSIVTREPIGVVGAVLPWNFPAMMVGWKLGPALATGNSVILKPAKLTSLSTTRLAELAFEAGVPAGVLNVLPGMGSTAGKAIGMHPDIDLVGFTGSTEVGRMFLEYSAASNLKEVLLECGGKNPQVVMPDIHDIKTVASNVLAAAFWNMGENCSAGSRLIVHRSIKDALLKEVLAQLESDWKLGDPLDPEVNLGALVEEAHMEKVLSYIATAKKEGLTLLTGGERVRKESGGYFVQPTIFDDATPESTIVREEIFGPVLAVMAFDTEEEAIALANDTCYGLAASLWSNDLNTVHRMSSAIRAGTVTVNCFGEGDITTPFGGFKQSGFGGRDKSIYAHDQYCELKTTWIKLT